MVKAGGRKAMQTDAQGSAVKSRGVDQVHASLFQGVLNDTPSGCKHECMCVNAHACMCMCVCACACTCECMCACECVCMCACVCGRARRAGKRVHTWASVCMISSGEYVRRLAFASACMCSSVRFTVNVRA